MKNTETKKRVLITASTYPNEFEPNQPAFVKELAESLKILNKELDIHVLIPHAAGIPKYKKMNNIHIHSFRYFITKLELLTYPSILPNIKANPLLIFLIPFLFISQIISVARITHKYKIDVLYSHWFVPQGVSTGIVSLIYRKPHVFTSHSSDVKIMKKIPILGKFLVRFFIEKMNKISVVSKRSLRKIKFFFNDSEWKTIKNKIAIIPMGVNIKNFAKQDKTKNRLKKKYGFNNKIIIFFIGRLAEKKGLKYLLRAFSKLTKVNKNIHLVIGGDGPLFKPLMKLVKNLNIKEYVTFLGYIHGKKKIEFFQLCDIQILPSIITAEGDAEGLPVVLMEGLASGNICIATNVSGADDIIQDGIDGLLIKSKSTKEIVKAVNKILSMSNNEREELSINARKTGLSFDWSIIARKHKDHLLILN